MTSEAVVAVGIVMGVGGRSSGVLSWYMTERSAFLISLLFTTQQTKQQGYWFNCK